MSFECGKVWCRYWVQKSNKHRGIEIKQIADLDLEQAASFVQEYISNPLLIDGRFLCLWPSW